MNEKHLIGALFYAALPFLIGVYIILVDAGVFKDKSGHDEFYQWIKSNRVPFLLGGILLIVFAVFEFLRYLGAFTSG